MMTLRRWKPRALAALLLLLAWPSLRGAPDELPEAAVQNPILRAHFTWVAMEARALIRPDGRRIYRRDFFLEQRVEYLVRAFLTDLIQRRREFNDAVEVAQLARQRALRQPANREARRVFKSSLQRVDKRAGRLRSLLRPVLSEFDSKSGTHSAVQGDFSSNGFELELQEIAAHAEVIEQLIESSFFQLSHTVEATTLGKGNMLIRLHQVQQLAGELARRVR